MNEQDKTQPETNIGEEHAKKIAPFIHISKTINDAPDSIEIGTPAKGGAMKIYGNFDKPEEFKKKIDNAAECRLYAQAAIEVKL